MRRLSGRLPLFTGLVLTAATLSATQAGAAPPTVGTDSSTTVSSPRTQVNRLNDILAECAMTNADNYFFMRDGERWYLDVSDLGADSSAGEWVNFGPDGTWDGHFIVMDPEPTGASVPASATLELLQQQSSSTSYHLELWVGLEDPARLDCTVLVE